VCVQRKREREREREKKQRENNIFFVFFEKKRLPPNKKIKKIKKMPWDQGPGLRCPGALVPGIPSKVPFTYMSNVKVNLGSLRNLSFTVEPTTSPIFLV
jgi:hypothetical protein